MKPRISLTQIQKPILAPAMQQSIEVLLLPLTDLITAIEQELQNNPLLEIDEERAAAEQKHTDEAIQQKLRHLAGAPRIRGDNFYENDDEPQEKPITRHTSLEDHLLQQLRLETTDPLKLKIGELIIGSLNEDGYFTATREEILRLLSGEVIPENPLLQQQTFEEALGFIQNCDPIGTASRSLRECLAIQAQHRFNGRCPLVKTLIEDHLEELGRKRFVELSRKLKVPVEEIKKAGHSIAALEPRPARNHRPVSMNIYIKPDISISANDSHEHQIHINQEGIPPLRINSLYQNMLKQPNRTEKELEFIRDKIRDALFFMKSIQQRHQTLISITQYITGHQKDFLKEGETALKPMTLKDVAEAVRRSESTISRAIHQKYIDTPQGLYPLKFFFSQAVGENNSSSSVSSRSMKEQIKQLIDDENKARPLSDQEIRGVFQQRGVAVARRTISKYRQALHILPSNLRKT